MTAMIEKGSQILGFYIDDLPVTTRINAGGQSWLKKPNGKWTEVPGGRNNYSRSDWINDGTVGTVEFIPYPVPNPESVISDAVLSSWRGQFMNAVRYGARDHGVGATLVNDAFRDIGLSEADADFTWQPGMGGRRGALYALRDLPDGSLVYSARRLYEKRASYFYQVAPRVDNSAKNLGDQSWSVLRVGPDGPLAAVEVRMTEGERQHELVLRSRAWQTGMRLKAAHGWCGSLESIMQAGGLSPNDAIEPGLKRSEVRSLPEGSLLFWQHGTRTGEWAVLRRNNGAGGTARTEFAFGTNLERSHPKMTPVWVSSRDWTGIPSWQVPNANEAAAVLLDLPVGTVVTIAHSFYRIDAHGGGHRFSRINARSGDRLYRSASRADSHGGYDATAFGNGQATMSIPFIPEESR